MLRIATANVNGIRAAQRRGMGDWLVGRAPDVLCLQEVRADDPTLLGALSAMSSSPGDWRVVHAEGAKGRAGVAVGVRPGLAAAVSGTRVGLGAEEFAEQGRWVELDLSLPGRAPLTVVSAYVHTGEADTPRQDEKYRFLAAARARLETLVAQAHDVVLTGDLNVAHREADLKNWKGNLTKAGFLAPERAWFDDLLGSGAWVDVQRSLAGEGPGPYSWWSWRGKAFDNDAGWRIDYQIASAALAATAVKAETDRAHEYAARWSDHAPVVVDYAVDL
ncbi:MAG: exodeoxyribonuclease III [Kineosporiaceae bacterium]